MNDFLAFRKMITPIFIQVIFWLFVIMIVIAGLFSMFQGGSAIFSGLLMIVVGPLFVRVYCELLILLFRIYDELVAIRTGTPPGGATGFPVMPAAGPQGYAPPPAYAQPTPPPSVPPHM
jgi:hypothetical protein